MRFDHQDFTLDDPVPIGTGVARKVNLWPTSGWKSFFISHSSINEAFGERPPDFFRGMRQIPFDDERTCRDSIGHWSILFSRLSS